MQVLRWGFVFESQSITSQPPVVMKYTSEFETAHRKYFIRALTIVNAIIPVSLTSGGVINIFVQQRDLIIKGTHIDYVTFYYVPIVAYPINSSPPEQNGHHSHTTVSSAFSF